MPTLQENLHRWSQFDFDQAEAWSEEWGGTENLWWSTLHPRLRHLLDTGVLLEIAPGGGRLTQFLVERCSRLILVDLSESSMRACRQRFAAHDHVEYVLNDGLSLDAVADGSVDLAVSYDSLVHCEIDVVEAYVVALGRKLVPGGHAFLHHSNFAALLDPETGEGRPNHHWRATSVCAGQVRRLCLSAGLECTHQELIGWGGTDLTDCFSLLTRPTGERRPETRVMENPDFMNEARTARAYGEVFSPAGG